MNSTTYRYLGELGILGLVGTLGCAGAPPPAQSPAEPMPQSGTYESLPATEVDQAEQELAEREQELDSELAGRGRVAQGEASSPAPMAQAPEAADASPSPAAGAGHADPCGSACRAFASMKNSAERLCTLAGLGHERCERANQRIAAATERLRDAGCDCGCGCGGR